MIDAHLAAPKRQTRVKLKAVVAARSFAEQAMKSSSSTDAHTEPSTVSTSGAAKYRALQGRIKAKANGSSGSAGFK